MPEIEKLTDADLTKQLAGLKAKVVECQKRHLALADEQKQYIEAMRPFSLEQERRHAKAVAGKTSREIRAEAKKR